MNLSSHKLAWVLFLSGALTLAGIFCIPAIPQPQSYHDFADQNLLCSIPHFWNVVSNLPFVVVALLALRRLKRYRVENHTSWVVFSVGVFLVGIGSSYYHWSPNNETLVWDRMPMTIGFMAAFCAIASEVLGPKMARLMWPFVLVGIASVCVWWAIDDLRFYAWVQFYPLIALAILLAVAKKQIRSPGRIVWALAFYIAAKVFENWDLAIYDALGQLMSGHAIKHVLAAMGTWELVKRLAALKVVDS